MKRTKTRWLLAGVLSLLLWPVSCAAPDHEEPHILFHLVLS